MMVQLERRLQRLLQLKDGWDGEGSPAPARATITRAERILALAVAAGMPPYEMLPTVSGGVCVIWEWNHHYVEVTLANSGDVMMHATNTTHSDCIDDDAIIAAVAAAITAR